jgi:hypothetical protein
MDSRKSASSSTIEINAAWGKPASRSRAQPLLHGRVNTGASNPVAPACEFVCSANKAAVASEDRLNFGLCPKGRSCLFLRQGMVKSATQTLAE